MREKHLEYSWCSEDWECILRKYLHFPSFLLASGWNWTFYAVFTTNDAIRPSIPKKTSTKQNKRKKANNNKKATLVLDFSCIDTLKIEHSHLIETILKYIVYFFFKQWCSFFMTVWKFSMNFPLLFSEKLALQLNIPYLF